MARARSRTVAPLAGALVDSLRGVGYQLPAAIADLIDNSIAAGATKVEVTFDWRDGDPSVAILDNGAGMTDAGLENAMRFGGAGPHVKRGPDDLGRFGLGLKTASFSQCRMITVSTVRDGQRTTLRWDLDHLRQGGASWELLEGPAAGSEHQLQALDGASAGTLVLWERVDFGQDEEPLVSRDFLSEIEAVEKHLGMVFHRFLAGDARRLAIMVNGRRVTAWDPFLEGHPSRIPRPLQHLGTRLAPVVVAGFILPHRDRFDSEKAYAAAGGPEGWNAQQGFYIYRNKRLLSAGGWMGLGRSGIWTREESSRLARIRIDITNAADRDWSIDVKKSVARPPASIRPRLSRIAEDVRRVARDVFVHRGAYGPRPKSSEVDRIWEVAASLDLTRYRIRRDHPAVELSTPQQSEARGAFLGMLSLIERTVPIDRIWLDVSEHPSFSVPVGEAGTDLTEAACAIARLMVRRGATKREAAAKVARLDPYDTVPGFEAALARLL